MSPKISIFHFCQLLDREVLCPFFEISRKKTVIIFFTYIVTYITFFILYEKIKINYFYGLFLLLKKDMYKKRKSRFEISKKVGPLAYQRKNYFYNTIYCKIMNIIIIVIFLIIFFSFFFHFH